MNDIIKKIEAEQLKENAPEFNVGDTVKVYAKIKEGNRERIQVFEGTDGMSLGNTHTRLTGRPMEIGLSPEILGRTFNGIGQPIDGLGDITPDVKLNINGLPLNPVARESVSYTHLTLPTIA